MMSDTAWSLDLKMLDRMDLKTFILFYINLGQGGETPWRLYKF